MDLRRMLVGRGAEFQQKWPQAVEMVKGMRNPDGRGRKKKD